MGIATRDWAMGDEPALGGSGHYRCALPARVMTEMGHDVVLGTLSASDVYGPELGVLTWDGERHFGFDVLLLQRWMFAGLADRIMAARARGQVVLNDVDDWYEGMDPAIYAWETSHVRSSRVENRDHYRQVLGASTAIVCSTPFLAERYRRLAPTVVVRNCLDLDRWSPAEPREGPPTLGWVGALPWRAAGDLEVLGGFLGPFLERHDLRFHHAGAMAPGWDLALATGIPPWRLDQSPLVPISEHEGQFAAIDVAVIPMADKPFNHGKSALKALQAAAAGVPFVASSTPEYRWLRDARRMGSVAKRPSEWIRHLEALMDPRVRAMDAVVNAGGVRGFGLPVLSACWDRLLSALVGGGR